jgi:hypothetical protein
MKKLAVLPVLLALTALVPVVHAQDTGIDTQRAAEAADREDRGEWGWIGLLGLVGLMGLKRRDRAEVRRGDAVVGRAGFEPATNWLKASCSTD